MLRGMFRCPQCKRDHPFTSDDMNELQCTDNEVSEIKLDRGLDNPSAITVNGYENNKFDTRTSTYRNASVKAPPLKDKDMYGRGTKNW